MSVQGATVGIDAATREQLLAVQARMLDSWAETEARVGSRGSNDPMLGRFKAAIDALPDRGDAIYQVNPLFRVVVESLLAEVASAQAGSK